MHHTRLAILCAGAGAAVLAFSTTDRASFDALPSWRSKVLEQCPGIAMALVQNKVDLIEQVGSSYNEIVVAACYPAIAYLQRRGS